MILSVVLGHNGGYTRFTGEDTKAQGDEETAGPRRSQGLSGANGGGTALAGRSPARCALVTLLLTRKSVPGIVPSGRFSCMCWHRKTTFAHPVLSVSHVTQIIPSNLHSKSGCIIPTLSIRKRRPGEVSSTIGPPRVRERRGPPASPPRAAASRPETANSRWFRSPPTLDAFSSPGAHRHLFYSAGCVTRPGLANSFCR